MKYLLVACIKADVKQLLLTKRDPGCLLNTWENEQSRSLIFDAPSFDVPSLMRGHWTKWIQYPTLRIMSWVLCQRESFLCYCLQNPTKEISPGDERDARAMPETSTSIWYKNTIHLLNITEQRSSSNTNSIIQYKGVRRFSTCIMLRVSSCCHLATGVIQLG